MDACFHGCFRALFGPKVQSQGGSCSSASSSGPSLRILTANDVYKPERFAMVRALAIRLKCDGVTKLVLPGDLLGGSLFASAHRGESVVDVLNALQVDYCVLGNHEFDYGSSRTRELMSKSKFAWLGSNVREGGSRGTSKIFDCARDLEVFEVPLEGSARAVKVGVFGLCTSATPELSHPGPEVVFEPPVAHAQRCVATLKERGCEFILALTHLTLGHDKELAESCPGIDVILGGHDHDPFLLVHRGTLIAKCGQNADHLGVLDLHMERAGSSAKLETGHSFQFLTTSRTTADPIVVAAVERWKEKEGGEELLCCIGDVALTSDTQELRTQENAFGCLVADAICWSYQAQGCQAAVQNGGFIRQNQTYPPHTALTGAQVREEMPFPKRPLLLRMRGEELRRGLEEMLAAAPTPAGSFPQLSQRLSLTYDPLALKLRKIQTLMIDGAEVEPDREYLIAISEFYASTAGDGVTAFASGREVCRHGKLIREVVIEYLRLQDSVSGKLPGRLREL